MTKSALLTVILRWGFDDVVGAADWRRIPIIGKESVWEKFRRYCESCKLLAKYFCGQNAVCLERVSTVLWGLQTASEILSVVGVVSVWESSVGRGYSCGCESA